MDRSGGDRVEAAGNSQYYDSTHDDSNDSLSDSFNSTAYYSSSENDYQDILDPIHEDNEEDEEGLLRDPDVLDLDDIDIVDETFEENNNDPNNNMDLTPPVIRSHEDDARSLNPANQLGRASSPRPGCSKDSVVFPGDLSDDVVNEEKTRHILHLVACISRHSVIEAIRKLQKKPASQFTIWDVIPEPARHEFQNHSIANTEIVERIPTKLGLAAKAPLSHKRGPAEDICTTGPKRSSSTPDIPTFVLDLPENIPKKNTSLNNADSSNGTTNHSATNVGMVIDPVNKISNLLAARRAPVTSIQKTCTGPPTATDDGMPKTHKDPGTKYGNQGKGKVLPSTQGPTVSTTTSSVPAVFAKPVAKKKSAVTQPHPSTFVTKGSDQAVLPAASTIPQGSLSRTSTVGTVRQAVPTRKQATATMQQPQQPQGRPVTLPAAQRLQQPQGRPVTLPAAQRLQQPQGRPVTLPPAQRLQQLQGRPLTLPAAQHPQQSQGRPVTLPAVPQASRAHPNVLAGVQTTRAQDHAQIMPAGRPIVQSTQDDNRFAMAQQQLRDAVRGLDAAFMVVNPTKEVIHLPKSDQAVGGEPYEQNQDRVVCMEMYYKLINIFPNVDHKYIKKLCPPEWGPGDRDAQLAPLVEHILARGEEVPQRVIEEPHGQEEPGAQHNTVDELYENLIGIFPDADPHYLRAFAEGNMGKHDAIKNFVESNLERRDYPTREQYIARLKITEQQRQYTNGFDVKQFLSIIPKPREHFRDPNRKCKHSAVAFEFLKSHFNKNRISTISRIYSQARYNLTIAASELRTWGEEMKSRRGTTEMATEDIRLLQEIAYIRHKKDISNYIANAKKKEDEEFRMLKDKNELLECQCCFDNECLPSKCSPCDEGHIFCNNCIVTGTSAKMGEGETRINCFSSCSSEFSLSVLQRVLAPTTFSILLKKRQAAEVIEAGLEGLVSCPFCHFASIPPEGDKIFKCLNPECTKESCRLCKELSHVPLKCDEVMKADKARRFIEEKMTEALARKCYKCQKAFFKEEGCNKITCVCGAMQCYLCDQPIKDYKHFRGQGSNDTNLCPLYSDTIRLDAVAVHRVAEQAQAEIMKQNPNVRIDTTGLLPVIPRPRVGPHQDVLNADELPRRAQRALERPPV